jgi:class 3 adenylate cyclase
VPHPLDSAERRQVTVMFSDLVGSAALSSRMDPEDPREIISVYQRCVAEAGRRYDGILAKCMGDGVLIYFGYPRAHEDDAERAVRAGLELIAAVIAPESRASLQARIGVAIGLVVVGAWELRAAMSMARLWRDRGKRQQAHDFLAPVYSWLMEGFDTLDLKGAKTLLEQLKA